jgi:hypothetical protein
MTLPKVKDYLEQFAKNGFIFPTPGLQVLLRNGSFDGVMMIAPEYSDSSLKIYNDYGHKRWDIKGHAFTFEVNDWELESEPQYDIVAIYCDEQIVAEE